MKTVFHLTSGDVDDWRRALGNVTNLLDDGTVEVEETVLLVNGDAIHLFAEGSPLAEDVRALGDDVRCLGCSNSLTGRDIPESKLLANVDSVPSGVGELTRLQSDGYAYLKVP
ncbi:DsrE family protein [Halogeometricum sp. S1BR25-6]|uniref:DsrE family protein n=1 Tax=Halogeometricum salsisoli TaxID=2950536 RepID=A0ABU2GE67_9EURY|nr:DsrE family protein [Halogeometricum sp. S1BR25-6]MDS0299095.1 DsrE family protein [Halogeometricum sp. S1BR25-6]